MGTDKRVRQSPVRPTFSNGLAGSLVRQHSSLSCKSLRFSSETPFDLVFRIAGLVTAYVVIVVKDYAVLDIFSFLLIGTP
jgi:hypothetical protein